MANMRILVTRRWPQEVERELQQYGEVTLNEEDEPLSEMQLRAALSDFDIVCPTVTDQLNAQVLASVSDPRTKLLANFGVGVNHIDLQQARQMSIQVTNTPGVLTHATAEIAMALLLMSARRTGEGERHLRAQAWTGWRPTHMLSHQITGGTLGIVGMGRIGIAMARKAHHGFGMSILYYSRSPLDDSIALELGARQVSLEELLSLSQFVSLHCPATPATHHLIDEQALRLMRSDAHLINTARGDVVDEVALVNALKKGEIAGAGLDVYEMEPALSPGLMALENTVLLPHMGSGTSETRIAMGRCAMDNVAAFVQGIPLPNQVEKV
ncbi:MAG: D-glycerate dehydrogenase [Pseudomonadota bacterium]